MSITKLWQSMLRQLAFPHKRQTDQTSVVVTDKGL